VPIAPDNLPDDAAALKRIIAAMAQDALTAQAEIARLKFQLARYRRAEFGRSSEKLARDTPARHQSRFGKIVRSRLID
jgi:transposase